MLLILLIVFIIFVFFTLFTKTLLCQRFVLSAPPVSHLIVGRVNCGQWLHDPCMVMTREKRLAVTAFNHGPASPDRIGTFFSIDLVLTLLVH